jgi:hypothetical protein
MAALKDKVANALNETRTLILGAQILLGFQLTAAFQPAFDRLSAHSRWLDLGGLALMSLNVGLLIAPAPYHRLAEGGRDTVAVHSYTTHMAEWALLPFALCIGIDVFIVAEQLASFAWSIVAGAILAGLAAVFWYGLEFIEYRRKGERPVNQQQEHDDPSETPVSEKIKTLMTEARVILPGAQALLGFQFTAFLTDGFEKLPQPAKLVHFASLASVALAIILLIAPAAYHRVVAQGEDRADVQRFGSAAVIAALLPLALGLSAEFYIVAARVGYADGAAIATTAVALAGFLFLWFVYPLLVRAWRRPR